ncbi:MAG: hypothetical protein WC763_07340 [Candidatus Paceibacterota bacterium]|jgi:hypothetical protein
MNDIREALEDYISKNLTDEGLWVGSVEGIMRLITPPAPASDARELGPTIDEWRIADAAGYSPEGKVFAQRAGEDWKNAMFWECVNWFDGYRAALLASRQGEAGDIEPGELIAEGECPVCGASLEITVGDDEGEMAVIGRKGKGIPRETIWDAPARAPSETAPDAIAEAILRTEDEDGMTLSRSTVARMMEPPMPEGGEVETLVDYCLNIGQSYPNNMDLAEARDYIKGAIVTFVRAPRPEASGEVDWCDLMVDEFIRIKNLTDNGEIIGLCDRAITNTKQHFPVMEQRDNMYNRWLKSQGEVETLRHSLRTLSRVGVNILGERVVVCYAEEIDHLLARQPKETGEGV